MLVEPDQKSLRQLTHEFFQYYPDYAFCRTLAFNIQNKVTSYRNAVGILAKKSWAAEQNQQQIEEKLNRRTIQIQNNLLKIKDLSLRPTTTPAARPRRMSTL